MLFHKKPKLNIFITTYLQLYSKSHVAGFLQLKKIKSKEIYLLKKL